MYITLCANTLPRGVALKSATSLSRQRGRHLCHLPRANRGCESPPWGLAEVCLTELPSGNPWQRPSGPVVRSYGCPCALNVRTRSFIYMWQAVHSLKACFWCGLEYCTRRSVEDLYGPRYKRDSARPRFLCATSRVNGRVNLAAGPKF